MTSPTVAELRERMANALRDAQRDNHFGRDTAPAIARFEESLNALEAVSHSEGYRAGVEASELVAAHNHRTWCCPCASAIRVIEDHAPTPETEK